MQHWHDLKTPTMERVNWAHLNDVPSTQEAMRQQLAASIPDVSPASKIEVISAATQSAGVGQRGRHWVSPEGAVAMTCAFPWRSDDMDKTPLVSLASVLAVTDVLEYFGLAPSVKWMNDVLVEGKKIAGVLVENFAHPHNTDCSMLLIGIGMNATNKSVDIVGVDQPVISLCDAYEGPIDLVTLRQQLFDCLWRRLHQLVSGDMSGIIAEVDNRLAFKGASIHLETEMQSIPCTIERLNEYGHLVVKNSNGVEAYRTGRIQRAS